MKAVDLTNEQRQEFWDEFYGLDENPLKENADKESELPWGAPWLWMDEELKGKNIQEMVKNYLDEYLETIKELLEEEARYKSEVGE